MKDLLDLMRIRHYTKNLLVFLPLVFSGRLLSGDLFISTLLGFAAFSLTSSVVYIVNDVRDIAYDRNHPVKRSRPLPSGRVSPADALRLAGLLGGAVAVLVLALDFPAWSTGVLFLYLAVNLLYSCGMKAIPYVDILIIVTGFVLRVFYGGLLIKVKVSWMLLVTVVFFSAYLAMGKRRSELLNHTQSRRQVLKYYKKEALDRLMCSPSRGQ
ncbi:MAG: hypothetical protein AVO33_02025 [delta proteobacterium ML8_F1]|nr:MAG: hypothetical protein AVO33_02025 [delta proteobacterium ML8_F1]